MASLPELDPRPISVAEYHRMIETGILDEDEHVELLEGVIARLSPQNDPHGFQAGIPEYWIVNLVERCIEIYRDPDAEAGAYRTTLRVEPGAEARPASVPGVAVPVAALFE